MKKLMKEQCNTNNAMHDPKGRHTQSS